MRICLGCRFLLEERKGDDLSDIIYRCRHFPNHVQPIGMISYKTNEFEYPEPITRRCYRSKRIKAVDLNEKESF